MSRLSTLLALPPILLGAATAAWLISTAPGPAPDAGATAGLAVRLAPVTAQDIRPTARGWGAVRAAETWTAVAEVRGQVIWRHPDLEDGKLVPAGTEVLRIDPACAAWGIEAWRRYPHVMVNVTRSMRNPFPVPSQGDAGARRVSAMIGDSAGVGSLLEKSDFLATFPTMLLAWDGGLRAPRHEAAGRPRPGPRPFLLERAACQRRRRCLDPLRRDRGVPAPAGRSGSEALRQCPPPA